MGRLDPDELPKCKDCKWSVTNEAGPAYMQCTAPQNALEDLIGDVQIYRWGFCSTQRTGGWWTARTVHECGRSGRWFVPRNTKPERELHLVKNAK